MEDFFKISDRIWRLQLDRQNGTLSRKWEGTFAALEVRQNEQETKLQGLLNVEEEKKVMEDAAACGLPEQAGSGAGFHHIVRFLTKFRGISG